MNVEVQVVKQVFKNDGTPITYDAKGRPIFTAKSLSSDFLPIKWLNEAAEDSPGKPVLYRHRSPENPEHGDEPIYGRVLESKVVEQEGKNFIVSKYTLFNTTERQRQLAEAIKKRYEEGNPLGISMGYHLYRIKETQEIIGTNVLEHSVTWKPQCKLCVMLEDNNMPDEKEKLKDKTSEEILTDLDEKRIKMEDLQDEVSKKAKEVETLKQESQSRNAVIEAQKQSLEKLTKDMAEMNKSVKALEAERDYLQKKPLIDEIVHLEASDEMLRDFYKTKEQKFLEDRIKVLKARPAPEAKIAETAPETRKQEEKPDEEKIKGGLRQFLAQQGMRQEIIDQVVGK